MKRIQNYALYLTVFGSDRNRVISSLDSKNINTLRKGDIIAGHQIKSINHNTKILLIG